MPKARKPHIDPRPTWYGSYMRGAYLSNYGECALMVKPSMKGGYTWHIGRGALEGLYSVSEFGPVQAAVVKTGQAETMGGAKLAAIAAAKKNQKACRIAMGIPRRGY